MKIVASYPTRLLNGTHTVPGETYDVSLDEGHALIYRGHAATAQEPPVAEPLPIVEDTTPEHEAPTTRKRV